jgi:hypothetical protein
MAPRAYDPNAPSHLFDSPGNGSVRTSTTPIFGKVPLTLQHCPLTFVKNVKL